MAVQNATALKNYFNTGDLPTEANFADLVDTIAHGYRDVLETAAGRHVVREIALGGQTTSATPVNLTATNLFTFPGTGVSGWGYVAWLHVRNATTRQGSFYTRQGSIIWDGAAATGRIDDENDGASALQASNSRPLFRLANGAAVPDPTIVLAGATMNFNVTGLASTTLNWTGGIRLFGGL